MEEKLDITQLLNAYNLYSNSLEFAEILESEYSDDIIYAKEGARAAVIQHFDYTYELSWKMMKKFLKVDIGDRADTLSRPELFKMIGEKQLITDFNAWEKYNKARNKTSHTYDEDIAEEVYDIAKIFKKDLEKFINELKQRTNIITYKNKE